MPYLFLCMHAFVLCCLKSWIAKRYDFLVYIWYCMRIKGEHFLFSIFFLLDMMTTLFGCQYLAQNGGFTTWDFLLFSAFHVANVTCNLWAINSPKLDTEWYFNNWYSMVIDRNSWKIWYVLSLFCLAHILLYFLDRGFLIL